MHHNKLRHIKNGAFRGVFFNLACLLIVCLLVPDFVLSFCSHRAVVRPPPPRERDIRTLGHQNVTLGGIFPSRENPLLLYGPLFSNTCYGFVLLGVREKLLIWPPDLKIPS